MDVVTQAPLGTFDPLVRSYVVISTDEVITVTLGRIVANPMLSAFEMEYLSRPSMDVLRQ